MAPLSGVRVLELCHFLAGPYAGFVLADLGADVLKVEDPSRPDDARTMGPHFQRQQSLYFASLNTGKRSIAVQLNTTEGRRVVEDLVRNTDVVIENYRPGVLAKLQLDHDALSAVNPAIITCSLSGYGASGPDSQRAGYDYTIQALAGVMSLGGEPGAPPAKAGISYVDHSGGLALALSVCAALVEKSRTGSGQHIDISLFDVQVSMLSYLASWKLNADASFERTASSAHPSLVPAQNFRTADGWMALFVGNDGMWARFVEAVRVPELRDSRFDTRQGRLEHRDEVLDLVQRVLLGAPGRDWEDRLGSAGVACAVVNDIGTALTEPQTEARELIAGQMHPAYGSYRYVRGPIPSRGISRAAPLLGEHTDTVLGQLGYSAQDILRLRAAGVIS